jgi:hypothetical protein
VYGAKPRLLLSEILAGDIATPKDAVEAEHLGQALQALDRAVRIGAAEAVSRDG